MIICTGLRLSTTTWQSVSTPTSLDVAPSSSIPINHRRATKGRGLAFELGVEAVIDRWEVGFGAAGIANRIHWKEVEQVTYSTADLLTGRGGFDEGLTVAVPDATVHLPVEYQGHVRYFADQWSTALGVGHGFGGMSFHGGVERPVGPVEVRIGVRRSFKKWNPSAGVGFDLHPRMALDVAVFGTNTNIQLDRKVAVAASIRLKLGVTAPPVEP
jgi:hypothetical protein